MRSEFGRITQQHFIESNLIEGVTDLGEIPKAIIAWNYLSRTRYLSTESILTTHRYLMDGLMDPRDVGAWRTCGVQVGGRICPSYAMVPHFMRDWLDQFWDAEAWKLSPKEQHVAFEHIHPFRDGNGRTGRMLMWWHECIRGETPTLITYKDRLSYYDWF